MTARSEAIPVHPVVSKEEWLSARLDLMALEKAHTRQGDELARRRRELPWVRVAKEYRFEGMDGVATLSELFRGRGQLVVYHFMLGPEWEQGCPSCSLIADHIDGAAIHLAQRDVTLTMVSRAPYARIREFQRRMGWSLPWVSSAGSDFNTDFAVSFTPEQVASKVNAYNFGTTPAHHEEREGMSVFARGPSGRVFHTYSVYARGVEPLIVAYPILDMVPAGRAEDGKGMYWVRHHDRYEESRPAGCQCQS
jgi:predicted dithiol-disulfide oxidoreductase (DUF899 family)